MTTLSVAKRRVAQPSSGHDDHKPSSAADVARALDDAVRIGATYATDRRQRFDVPVIAFVGEPDEPLLAPLRASDVLKIKTRGVATQQHESDPPRPVAWEVAGGLLESQNPRWHAFLDELVVAKRKRLGIAPTASVETKLSRLLLAEQGGRVLVGPPRAEERPDGAFGSLVVVLPGSFTGGTVLVDNYDPLHDEYDWEYDDDEEEHEDEYDATTVWWRGGEWDDKGEAFDLMCAAFHDCCEFESEPIQSGSAVCLVYDLVTRSTPTQIRLYAGNSMVQQAVNAALTGFFDVASAPLAKRFKIGSDAWRIIRDFVSERPFVYIVNTDKVDEMYGPCGRIARSLEAFCAQSHGQYVLYLASVMCSRRADVNSSSDEDSAAEDQLNTDDSLMDTRVTLTAPWVKYGNPAERLSCPPLFLKDYQGDVAPVGHIDRLPLRKYLPSDRPHYGMLRELHEQVNRVRLCKTYALVVLPASVERRQIAQLPIPDSLAKLRSLMATSHDEAVGYARRIIHYRPEWPIYHNDVKHLATFVDFVIQLNDLRLFEELLHTVDLHEVDKRRTMRKAVDHFGLDACAGAILKRLCSTPTGRGRVHLFLAVVDESMGIQRVDSLLDALLSLYPWTDVLVDASSKWRNAWDESELDVKETHLLFEYAYRTSPQRALQVVSVKDPAAMVWTVLPALTKRAEMSIPPSVLRDMLDHAYKLFEPMLPEIFNEPFARVQIPKHCAKCDELQCFFASKSTDTTIQCTEDEYIHVLRVLDSISFQPFSAQVYAPKLRGSAVRLYKHREKPFAIYDSQELYFDALDMMDTTRQALSDDEEG